MAGLGPTDATKDIGQFALSLKLFELAMSSLVRDFPERDRTTIITISREIILSGAYLPANLIAQIDAVSVNGSSSVWQRNQIKKLISILKSRRPVSDA